MIFIYQLINRVQNEPQMNSKIKYNKVIMSAIKRKEASND